MSRSAHVRAELPLHTVANGRTLDVARRMENVHFLNASNVSQARILKQTKTLTDRRIFDHVHIVGVWQEGLGEREELGPSRTIHRLRLRLVTGRRRIFLVEIARYLEFAARAVWRFRGKQYGVVNVHSLGVLPVGALLKVLFGKRLVYDTHELETETAGKVGVRKVAAKVLERALIGLVDETVTVSASIGAWYQEKYRLERVHVVRNVPYRPHIASGRESSLRADLRIPPQDIVFIYQGLLVPERSIEKLLELFRRVRPERHLVLMGTGELEEKVREAARNAPNIHFHPAVPLDQLLDFTAEADIGVHYIENTCLNHYYCLPNKLFEYITAGLPVMVRDFPEMAGIVRRFDCGWILPEGESGWMNVFNAITRQAVEEKKASARSARESMGWHLEEAVYLRVFDSLVTN